MRHTPHTPDRNRGVASGTFAIFAVSALAPARSALSSSDSENSVVVMSSTVHSCPADVSRLLGRGVQGRVPPFEPWLGLSCITGIPSVTAENITTADTVAADIEVRLFFFPPGRKVVRPVSTLLRLFSFSTSLSASWMRECEETLATVLSGYTDSSFGALFHRCDEDPERFAACLDVMQDCDDRDFDVSAARLQRDHPALREDLARAFRSHVRRKFRLRHLDDVIIQFPSPCTVLKHFSRYMAGLPFVRGGAFFHVDTPPLHKKDCSVDALRYAMSCCDEGAAVPTRRVRRPAPPASLTAAPLLVAPIAPAAPTTSAPGAAPDAAPNAPDVAEERSAAQEAATAAAAAASEVDMVWPSDSISNVSVGSADEPQHQGIADTKDIKPPASLHSRHSQPASHHSRPASQQLQPPAPVPVAPSVVVPSAVVPSVVVPSVVAPSAAPSSGTKRHRAASHVASEPLFAPSAKTNRPPNA